MYADATLNESAMALRNVRIPSAAGPTAAAASAYRGQGTHAGHCRQTGTRGSRRIMPRAASATLAAMSVNLQFEIEVRRLRGLTEDEEDEGLTAEGSRVAEALRALLRRELLERETFVDHVGGGRVLAYTTAPVVISRPYLWRPEFEQRVRDAVAALTPHGEVQVRWSFPDQR